MASFVRVNDVLTVVVNNGSYPVGRKHPNYDMIIKGLADGSSDDDVYKLISNRVKEERVSVVGLGLNNNDFDMFAEFSVSNKGELLYDGSLVDNNIKDYFIGLKSDGLPFMSMVRFVKKLYASVEHRVRMELLEFVKNHGISINEIGNLLFYKAVREDYLDKFSGTISNEPGTIVKMDRAKVDKDRMRGCSCGLHCGGLQYIYQYGHGNDRIVIVEVNPKDVISVPSHLDAIKVRVCEYKVINDYQGQLNNLAYDSNKPLYEQEEEEKSVDWSAFSSRPESVEPDDMFEDGDVSIINIDGGQIVMSKNEIVQATITAMACDKHDLGTKPDGTAYWNVRNTSGKFTKKN